MKLLSNKNIKNEKGISNNSAKNKISSFIWTRKQGIKDHS